MTLKEQAKELFDAYAKTLSEQWEIDDPYWIGGEFDVLSLGDIYLNASDVMRCVDENVSYEEFSKWYEYDLDMHYGIDLGERNAHTINLRAWLRGYPEELKVPMSVREEWNKRYWNEFNKGQC